MFSALGALLLAGSPQPPANAESASISAPHIRNAADLTDGPVAPGEIVILNSSNAGPLQMVPWGLEGNLKTTFSLGETRVFFNGVPSPLIYSVQGQIGTLVPRNLNGRKTVRVEVEYQGRRSPPSIVPVTAIRPAVFTLNATGRGQAAMLNETGCCNSVRNPALQGSVVSLYATGEGILPTGHAASNVSVTVGGVPARVVYAGSTISLQVNFRVPVNAPTGDAVPLILTINGRHTSSDVTMAVRSATRRVLLVNSDAAVVRRITQSLTRAHYEVFAAVDLSQAEAHVRQQPDLLILNLSDDPEQAAALIRKCRPARPQLRILALGSSNSAESLRQADLLGAEAYLATPVKDEDLLARVRTLLTRRAAVY